MGVVKGVDLVLLFPKSSSAITSRGIMNGTFSLEFIRMASFTAKRTTLSLFVHIGKMQAEPAASGLTRARLISSNMLTRASCLSSVGIAASLAETSHRASNRSSVAAKVFFLILGEVRGEKTSEALTRLWRQSWRGKAGTELGLSETSEWSPCVKSSLLLSDSKASPSP